MGNLAILALGLLLGWLGATLSHERVKPVAVPAPLDQNELYEATFKALDHPDSSERTVLTVGLLHRVTNANWTGMLRALEDRAPFTREQEQRLILRELAKRNPRGTLKVVSKWPRQRAARGVQVVLFEWARIDPVTALEAAKEVSGDDQAMREAATRGVVYGWSWARHPGLSDFIRTLGDEFDALRTEFAMIQAAELLRHEGSQALSEWALEQTQAGDLDWARTAVNQTMNALGPKQPDVAARFLEQYGTESWASEAPRWLTGTWANYDPKAAITWLKTLPASPGQYQGMYYAWKTWFKNAPEEARAWLGVADAAPYRDGALVAFIETIRRRDPPRAIRATLDIQARTPREQIQVDILRRWLSTRRSSAEAWLAENPMPKEIVAQAQAQSRAVSRGDRIGPRSMVDQDPRLSNP